jgi:hypothetical protein
MAATARSFSARTVDGYAQSTPRWKDMTLLGMITNIRKLSQQNDKIKLGLILLGLWALNWVY